MRRATITVLTGLMLMTTFTPLHGDEGMWLLNNLPEKYLKETYNFTPTDEWVEHIQKSSVRFSNGGSASFISPNGLVMTNHHVGSDLIQSLSSKENNYMHDGFLAKTTAEELKCEGLELNVLMEIRPVTDEVKGAVKSDMSDAEAAAARRAKIAEIETQAGDATGMKPQVVTLYRGARYDLYLYKRYTDVRLVMAPEHGIGFFGGDIDNFGYPRYNLDVAFFRAYEEGKPANTPHYLKWSEAGISENDLIFISGHPGSTRRLYTVAHLEFMRDTWLPLVLETYNQREVALQQLAASGAEQARIAAEDMLIIQNGRKAFGGMLAGLLDERVMDMKREEEARLRGTPKADDAWGRLESALKKVEPDYAEYFLLANRRTGLSELYSAAVHLVRSANQRKLPDGERFPEYQDAALPSLELRLFAETPIHDELEQLRLEDGITRIARILGGDHAIAKTLLGGIDPETRAANLLGGTKLRDIAERRRLYEGGLDAINACNDPMIQLAKAMEAFAIPARKKYEDTFESVETGAYADIADARFAKYGEKVYPDATFTLRLSIGTVKGYDLGGARVEPFTNISGAFQHAEAHDHREPFALPKSWMTHRGKLNGSVPFNFVTTNDIIGGNSGSPMMNRKGELIGIVFDGNIQSLVWDFQFDDRVARSVGVDARAIIEALRVVYEADNLVGEILGGKKLAAATDDD